VVVISPPAGIELELELELELNFGLAGIAAVTVADAATVAFGLDVVIFASSFTCSPLVLDLGTSTAACSSTVWPLPSVLSLHVVVWPLGHTTKWGVALAGLLVRVTVMPPAFAPEDESHIATFAVPPGFTLALPEKTSALSHSFTDVGPATMNAAVWIAARCSDEAGVEEADADGDLLGAWVVPEGANDAFAGDGDIFAGDGVVFFGAGVVFASAGVVFFGAGVVFFGAGVVFFGAGVVFFGDGVVFLGDGDAFDGDGDDDFDGDGLGDGLAGIVAVTHGRIAASRAAAGCAAADCAAAGRVPASGPDPDVAAALNEVAVMTAPTTHMPVATPARADPCLRTLTRLTPFLRSSVKGSSFTRSAATLCATCELS